MSEPLRANGEAGTRSFGRYEVVRALGAGGMGEVFLARDDLLAREVAIKTLRPVGPAGSAAELQARFLNEARAVASLAHPHVVRVFDLGFEDETPFLVMEVIGGRSLRDRMRSGDRLALEEVRVLGSQIGRALDAAHARGIVHRDVKPGNVLEAEPGVWKLADFGVAHVPDSSLTMTGQFVGSPAYAAPEALLAGEFSPATDVYGLGATLYEALGGEPPYGGPAQVSTAALARREDPHPIALRCPRLPAEVAEIVQRALARDPRARPAAAELAAALLGTLAPAVAAAPSRNEAMARVAALASAARRALGRKRWPWVAGGVIAAAMIVALVASALKSGGGRGRAPQAAAAASLSESSERSREQQKRWLKAQEKLAEGKYDDAVRELEKLLERNPDDAEARELLERIEDGSAGNLGKRQQRRWLTAEDAAMELEKVLEQNPDDAQARALLDRIQRANAGWSARRRGQPDE